MLLRAWLAKPEFGILRNIMVSKCRLEEQAALVSAHKSQESENFNLVASDAIEQAKLTSKCIDLLESIAEQPRTERFHTVKLKA